MKIFCVVIALVSFMSASAVAGDSSGKVTHLMAYSGNVVMFAAGQHNNPPPCSTVGNHWALSLNSETGKAMYAMLLSAAAQGHTVNVFGENACSAWGDRESPMYMWVDY